MAFRTQDMETAQFGNPFTQYDIGSAPCHVGSNGNLSHLARVRNDHSFLFMILGIQHVMGNTLLFQQCA